VGPCVFQYGICRRRTYYFFAGFAGAGAGFGAGAGTGTGAGAAAGGGVIAGCAGGCGGCCFFSQPTKATAITRTIMNTNNFFMEIHLLSLLPYISIEYPE
jgi:hypothetical protein